MFRTESHARVSKRLSTTRCVNILHHRLLIGIRLNERILIFTFMKGEIHNRKLLIKPINQLGDINVREFREEELEGTTGTTSSLSIPFHILLIHIHRHFTLKLGRHRGLCELYTIQVFVRHLAAKEVSHVVVVPELATVFILSTAPILGYRTVNIMITCDYLIVGYKHMVSTLNLDKSTTYSNHNTAVRVTHTATTILKRAVVYIGHLLVHINNTTVFVYDT